MIRFTGETLKKAWAKRWNYDCPRRLEFAGWRIFRAFPIMVVAIIIGVDPLA